jgi:hypothetical protein
MQSGRRASDARSWAHVIERAAEVFGVERAGVHQGGRARFISRRCMPDGEETLSASFFGHGVTGYQWSAKTRLPCVSISKTMKRKTNASNN